MIPLDRSERLALARDLAANWGRWCKWRGEEGSPLGKRPRIKCGGMERLYRPPPQWNPPNPRPPEPHDPTGYEWQITFAKLPEIYRRVLRAEFCVKPWLVVKDPEAAMITCAIVAHMTPRLYPVTVDRALLHAVHIYIQSRLKEALTYPQKSNSVDNRTP